MSRSATLDGPRAGPGTLATAGVMFGAACFGTLPLFTRILTEAGLAAPAVAFWRFALTALVLLPVVLLRARAWRALVWALLGGAAMGLGWIGFVHSLGAMSVAAAGVLFMTYPAFAILIAALVFGVPPQPRGLLATALIVLAAALAAPRGSLDVSLAGGAVAFALLAPAAYGFLLNVLALKLDDLPPLAAVGAVAFGSIVALFPLVASLPWHAFVPANPAVLPWLFGFSVATALLPQLLFVLCAPAIGPVRTAISGSMELVAMLAVATLAFGEALRPPEVVAAALVIGAVVLGALGRGAPARG